MDCISNQIEKIRKYKKISQKKLAEKIDYSETGYRKAIEKGTFGTKTLLKISKVLNVPVIAFCKKDEDVEKLIINGNYNNVGKKNNLIINENKHLSKDIERLENHIKTLEKQIKDKEKIIELLTKK